MKFRIILLFAGLMGAALLLQACSRPLAPQESCNFVQNPDLQRVSWKGKLPIKLYVDQSVPQEAYSSLQQAIDTYNNNPKIAGGRQIFQIVQWGSTQTPSPAKDGYSTIYWMKRWDTDNTAEQARTTIYWSGDEIFEADMRVDAQNFTFNYGDNTDFINVDLQSLFLHELGHVLGLAHTTLPDSAMEAVLNYGQTRRQLGADDYGDIKCEY